MRSVYDTALHWGNIFYKKLYHFLQVFEIVTEPFPDALHEAISLLPCINVTVIEIASLRFPLLYFPTQYAVVPSIFRVGFPEIAFVLIAAEVGIMTVASNSTRKNSGIILFFIKTPPLCFE